MLTERRRLRRNPTTTPSLMKKYVPYGLGIYPIGLTNPTFIPGLLSPMRFVEFASHSTAGRVLKSYAGTEHSIFVGDLAPDVTDYLLQETFYTQYLSLRDTKVITDPNAGRSKGYDFVKLQTKWKEIVP
ncbi:unnamed protein product [Lactuca saligna]|uniref:RRM domain-containing protein n=1 Tax=Lactuca saligna TaxID=75948 RepID=A0AA35YI12_LACSI|nr:unnamed protein product [Lactuca saligna]